MRQHKIPHSVSLFCRHHLLSPVSEPDQLVTSRCLLVYKQRGAFLHPKAKIVVAPYEHHYDATEPLLEVPSRQSADP